MNRKSWVSASKKLPQAFRPVLVTNGSEMLIAACLKMKDRDTAVWMTTGGRCFPTHWMPLPEPPEVT